MSTPAAAFYFDLADPLSYLAAERILHVLPGPAEWQPVFGAELRSDATAVSLQRPEQNAFRAEIARRAEDLGLQPLRWPYPFPFDSSFAMRVATYAKSIGRTVPFAQAAFRQAYAGGRSLEHPDSVVIAAAACEMHPTAVLAAAERRGVAEELARATAAAAAAGVRELPAVTVGGEVFAGADALARADARMRTGGRTLGGGTMGGSGRTLGGGTMGGGGRTLGGGTMGGGEVGG